MLNKRNMPEEIKNISIVVPVYNSSVALKDLQSAIDKAMKQQSLSYKLILIDDGSEDTSWEVIKDLKNKNTEIIRVCYLRSIGNSSGKAMEVRTCKKIRQSVCSLGGIAHKIYSA